MKSRDKSWEATLVSMEGLEKVYNMKCLFVEKEQHLKETSSLKQLVFLRSIIKFVLNR